ncbi:MAG TPA: bacillithiol biosynthesis cysteine-adding enzyme BshC [Aridibacter sp.]|nr:bacillithiol biosynthesis cysteine-adding enzyme BshC [Aridibacter sp.]
MNVRPGTAAGTRPYEITRLDLRSVPGQSPLFLDFLYDHPKVLKFYPNLERELSEVANDILESYSVDRSGLCAMLETFNRALGAESETLLSIDRLRSSKCVAVMTGQQAGLFSGPAYTIYKAVSAIRFAGELARSGIEAVPVFWIASEDHDLDEVSETWFPGGADGIAGIAYESEIDDFARSVGNVSFGEPIEGLVELAGELLSDPDRAGRVADLLKECYVSGATFSSAFGRLLLRILGRQGLVLASPLGPDFRTLAAPIVKKAVEKAAEIGDSLRQRDFELKGNGYHSQVHAGEDFFPFFLIDEDGRRVPLRLDGIDLVRRQDTNESIAVSELVAKLDKDPSILSPNAIMRPVVQDFVFPNVCYFGGSAEVAYFAQNSAVYEVLGRPSIPIRHRASFTILEPKNRRTLLNYSLRFEDILKGREAVTGEIKEKFLDPETSEAFRRTRSEFEKLIDGLKARLEKSEPTLAESLTKRRKRILWHLETLHEKFLKAESFKDEVAARRLAYLFNTALPNDALQERTINFLYFYALFGDRLIEWLIESAGSDGSEHTILTF